MSTWSLPGTGRRGPGPPPTPNFPAMAELGASMRQPPLERDSWVGRHQLNSSWRMGSTSPADCDWGWGWAGAGLGPSLSAALLGSGSTDSLLSPQGPLPLCPAGGVGGGSETRRECRYWKGSFPSLVVENKASLKPFPNGACPAGRSGAPCCVWSVVPPELGGSTPSPFLPLQQGQDVSLCP